MNKWLKLFFTIVLILFPVLATWLVYYHPLLGTIAAIIGIIVINLAVVFILSRGDKGS